MMLRLSNSLFIEWSAYKRRPDHVTTTDFQFALFEDHHRPALRLALSKYPTSNDSHELALVFIIPAFIVIPVPVG